MNLKAVELYNKEKEAMLMAAAAEHPSSRQNSLAKLSNPNKKQVEKNEALDEQQIDPKELIGCALSGDPGKCVGSMGDIVNGYKDYLNKLDELSKSE